MRFSCDRPDLLAALTTASKAIGKGAYGWHALSCLRLELADDRLSVSGHNREIGITTTVAVAGKKDGEALIGSNVLMNVVKALTGDQVSFDIKKNQASIECGSSKFGLKTESLKDYPDLEEDTADVSNVASDVLSQYLKQVLPAASTDQSRPVLTGVLLQRQKDSLRAIATDSYRMALRDIPDAAEILDEGQFVNVPASSIREVTNLFVAGQADVGFTDRWATFGTESTKLSTRLIQGDYPNVDLFMNLEQPNRIAVDRDAFIGAITLLKTVTAQSRSTPLVLSTEAGGSKLLMSVEDAEIGFGKEVIDCECSGKPLEGAFNIDFMVEGAKSFDGERLSVLAQDKDFSPVTLEDPEAPDLGFYLLMPIRV